jgi:hypothetical protein
MNSLFGGVPDWPDSQWRKEARALVSEARLHANASEKQIGGIWSRYFEPRRNEAIQRDVREFKALEKDLRECHICEVYVNHYFKVLERSWKTGNTYG